VFVLWNVADLHSDFQRDSNIKGFALDEKGLPVNGQGYAPNQHDISAIRDAEDELGLGNSLDAVPEV
jgi:hypothetical protein